MPMGEYGVGTKAFELNDNDRMMLRGTKTKRWMVQAFYPTDTKNEQTSPYMPGTLDNGMIGSHQVLTYGHPQAAISTKGPFPVIIFIHGLGEIRQRYTILCEELASQGYIVLSLDQPYMSQFTQHLDGTTIVPSFYDMWKVKRDRDYRYQYFDDSMQQSIADVRYILDHMQGIDQDFLSSQWDGRTVILMGHSFGGNVAHTLGFSDERIKAVVDIDSKITERKIFGRAGVPPNDRGIPVLFIRATRQYQEDVGDQLKNIQNAHILNFDVEHSAFQDTAFLVRKIPGLGQENTLSKFWTWFWKTGPIFEAVDVDLSGQNVVNWFNEIRLEIVSWLAYRVPKKKHGKKT